MRNSRHILFITVLGALVLLIAGSNTRSDAIPIREQHMEDQTVNIAISDIHLDGADLALVAPMKLDVSGIELPDYMTSRSTKDDRREGIKIAALQPPPVQPVHEPSSTVLQSDTVSDYRAVPSLRQHLPLNIAELANLTGQQRTELECLAWNIYFEVRGGTKDEQVAVAYVPINRIGKPEFSNNICSNVFQYGWAGGRRHYQFSWAGTVRGPNWQREDETWEKVQQLAWQVYNKQIRDPSRGATYFHWAYMASWAPNTKKTRIGSHVFWTM